MSEQIVKLNVGGVFYDTSLQTLSVEGSYFSGRFSGNWNEENGRIFIDRDGNAFEYVLDFLRNGSTMVFPESAEMRDRVRREADFYIFPDLAELLKTDVVKLDIGGVQYTSSIETLSQSPYFSRLFSGNWNSRKEENGRIFIDRDGEAFKYILGFLRNSRLFRMSFGIQNASELICIFAEANFYELPDLENLVKESMTMNLRICSGRNSGSEFYDVSVNLQRLTMYPGNWFEKKEMLLQDDRGYYLLDRGQNYIASAIVAEYVGSSEREVIKSFFNPQRVSGYNLDHDHRYALDREGILDAVAFFEFPQALGQEIITHYNRMRNIPELHVYTTQTHLR